MTKLQSLYEAWANADPKKCYCTHFDMMTGAPKPDDKVCEREIAWRRYCEDRGHVEIKDFQAIEKSKRCKYD